MSAIPEFRSLFSGFAGDSSAKPKAILHSPFSIAGFGYFPANREITGNYARNSGFRRLTPHETSIDTGVWNGNSLLTGTGNFESVTGIFQIVSGKL